MEEDEFFVNAMRGEWNKVVDAYKNDPSKRWAKITRSEDTALHLAVDGGRTDVVSRLIKVIEEVCDDEKDALKILSLKNERGNTPLHFAALHGDVEICHLFADKYPDLIGFQNNEHETPLFLSVVHGKKNAYLCLSFHYREKNGVDTAYTLCRRGNSGETILHAAISGEYFSLALRIISDYPNLMNYNDEHGLSPLHVLACQHHAFKSSTFLGSIDTLIYKCILGERGEARQDHRVLRFNGNGNGREYPGNYEACISFFRLINTCAKVLTKTGTWCESNDEENPERYRAKMQRQETSVDEEETIYLSCAEAPVKQKVYPPNYESILRFLRLVLDAFLIVFGLGYWRIQKIREKKENHGLAIQIMNKMVQNTRFYKYDYNYGGKPTNMISAKTEEVPTEIPETILNQDETQGTDHAKPDLCSLIARQKKGTNSEDKKENKIEEPKLVAAKTEFVDKFLDSHPPSIQELNTSDKKRGLLLLTYEKKETEKLKRRETPILIAAKRGVTEMVSKILDTFPVSIQDMDEDKKNVVLVAVENRQTDVYKLLLNRKVFKDEVFCKLDNDGNSALHLAATFGDHRPRTSVGAALQMQWELKWYRYVKGSMRPNFFARHNKLEQTAKAVFTETHKDLVIRGGEWLSKTSKSCSVVAALIASVSFGTSATVPGGVKGGRPTLENQPAFFVFAISSLIALCFSVTSLVFFLSILTSRYQEKDFTISLPRKLLLGLSSLFISIASMLISFCAGHFFVVIHKLKFAAFPVYAATCVPVVTFFALAQLPLYFDLVKAIFDKVPQRGYMH